MPWARYSGTQDVFSKVAKACPRCYLDWLTSNTILLGMFSLIEGGIPRFDWACCIAYRTPMAVACIAAGSLVRKMVSFPQPGSAEQIAGTSVLQRTNAPVTCDDGTVQSSNTASYRSTR